MIFRKNLLSLGFVVLALQSVSCTEKIKHKYTEKELVPKVHDSGLPGYYFSGPWHERHPYSCIKLATDKNFKELVLENDKPVIVDFMIGGCHGCEIMAPILYKLCEKYEGEIDFISHHAGGPYSEKYNVHTLPTITFFYKGKPKKEFWFNVETKEKLEKRIEKFLESIKEQ